MPDSSPTAGPGRTLGTDDAVTNGLGRGDDRGGPTKGRPATTATGTGASTAATVGGADDSGATRSLGRGPADGGADGFGPGDEIDEFQILQRLGRGAFASVYLARQSTAQRLVALKIGEREDGELIHLAQLDHPSVVRVYDRRRIANSDRRFLYLEYVPGGTLQAAAEATHRDGRTPGGAAFLEAIDAALTDAGQAIPERSPLREAIRRRPWPQTVAWIGARLADALASAHRRDILHLDVKPANVLLAADGLPKLTDFNVSVATAGADADDPAGRGTVKYMAPEQIAALLVSGGPTIDGRADVYSLGLVLWNLLHGTLPWSDEPARTPRQVPDRDDAATEVVPPLTALQSAAADREGLAVVAADGTRRFTPLERLLLAALAPDPEDRPRDAREFAARLRLALFPEVEPFFAPRPGGVRAILRRAPPAIVCGALLLIPNVAAGVFNFYYNETQILTHYPQMRAAFGTLATVVNAVAYPAGLFLLWAAVRPLSREAFDALSDAKFDADRAGADEAADASSAPIQAEAAASRCWSLGHTIAAIGGGFWALAGIVYPVTLRILFPEFAWADMGHFFLSLLICGGIAWTLPFFLGTLLGLFDYYPLLVRRTLRDGRFRARRRTVERRTAAYVLAAALIPLTAAALHSLRSVPSTAIVLGALAVTAAGLVAGLRAYRHVQRKLEALQEFLEA